jgi:hypothetical protein
MQVITPTSQMSRKAVKSNFKFKFRGHNLHMLWMDRVSQMDPLTAGKIFASARFIPNDRDALLCGPDLPK